MGALTKEVLKFIVVGVFSTIVNYLCFYILYEFVHINYMISSASGYMLGVLAGYVLNKRWTFKSDSKSKTEIVKYYVVYLISLAISLKALELLVTGFGLDPKIAQILVIGISTVINFLGLKLFIFTTKGNK